jgi:heterodisulfide reductase subunit C
MQHTNHYYTHYCSQCGTCLAATALNDLLVCITHVKLKLLLKDGLHAAMLYTRPAVLRYPLTRCSGHYS